MTKVRTLLHTFDPDWCVEPGATLRDYLDEHRVTRVPPTRLRRPRRRATVASVVMRVRTLWANEPFDDNPVTGERTPRPERGTWWELQLWISRRDGGFFSILPAVGWEFTSIERTVGVRWLWFALSLWWQLP